MLCRYCQSDDLAGERVSGRGTLYTWTIAVQPFHPFYVDRIPYIVATVELEEEPGLMFMTQLTDCTEDDLRIGMPVEVTFVELHPELTLPFFRPARGRCVMATAGRRVAVAGVGYSHVGRNTGLSIDDHMIAATKAALADSGLVGLRHRRHHLGRGPNRSSTRGCSAWSRSTGGRRG